MNYIKITKQDIANGTGIRTVLWLSGCSVHCKNCHNPQTWDKDAGQLFDDKAKEELFQALSKPYVKGLTLSGGHPLEDYNSEGVLELLQEVREKFPNKDIWLYTGLTFEELFPEFTENKKIDFTELDYTKRSICFLCDVLVDGPFIEELKDLNLDFRGSSNQRLLDIKKTFYTGKISCVNSSIT